MFPAIDNGGNLRLGIRRALFGLFGLAVLGTGTTVVLNRISTDTYSSVERKIHSFKNSTMESIQTFGGIQPGRTYAAKQPGFAQTSRGGSVFNDRRVVDAQPTGGGVLDYEVHYIAPGNDTPVKTTGTEFLSWVGRDITESLPPAEGDGETGTGHNWRPYSGPGVAPTDIAPSQFITGAGQMEADPNAQHPQAPAHREGGEGGQPVEVVNSPATAPTIETLNTATAVASNAQQEAAPVESAAEFHPRNSRPKSSDSTSQAEATASGETLKDRAKKH